MLQNADDEANDEGQPPEPLASSAWIRTGPNFGTGTPTACPAPYRGAPGYAPPSAPARTRGGLDARRVLGFVIAGALLVAAVVFLPARISHVVLAVVLGLILVVGLWILGVWIIEVIRDRRRW